MRTFFILVDKNGDEYNEYNEYDCNNSTDDASSDSSSGYRVRGVMWVVFNYTGEQLERNRSHVYELVWLRRHFGRALGS